jgi:RNA polymerase-binding transcription factor DksA
MKADDRTRVSGVALDRAQLDDLRRQLDEERSLLAERLGAVQRHPTRIDVDESLVDVTVARTSESLSEIDAALARLDAGTYGWCEECGDAIPVERLEVIPAAARCVRCQSQRTSMLR